VLIAVAVLLALLLPESLRPLTVPIRPLTVALAYLGFCGIGLLHEFGHATACARYGCPPGPIGFGLYLIFPAFYTDVTSAWRLDRRARAIIDIGGVYFSCIAQLILGVAIVMVHSPLASTLFAINAYTILHNLNPVFKLDGYWLCSDLAGLHNLHLRMTEEVRRIVARLRRRPIPVSPEDAASQWLLRIYFAIVCLYTLFVARFLQLAIPNLLLSLPRAFAAAWHKALQGSPSFSESIANIATLIGTLVWPAMVVIALLVLLHRLCLAILRSTGRLAQAGNVENKQ